ncbi:MAG: hybrid sensor histidine kinase/response regulator [Campylobacterales bacterium]|nr:hybrid sensor histidine kinase/response regulator [Campylobacterales bacterium]
MSKPTILAVDDERSNIDIISSALQHDYDLRIAHSGLRVLEILDKFEVDLIVLDIEMPQIDGFEVAKKIRNNPDTANMPIIFVTSYRDEEHIIKGFELGGNDYITKPFRPIELKVRIDNHIKSWYYQKEISKLNDELKQKITDEKIKNEQQKRLVVEYSKNAALGVMISAIAHQWKQPINVLSLLLGNIYLSHIKEELDSQKLEHFYQQGKLVINEMSQTIDDFANFFKPSKQKSKFSIAQSLAQVALLIDEQFKNHKITLTYPKSSLVEGYGYPNEFKQVIINLLSNAKDAIDEKGIEGKIECSIEQSETMAILKIGDNAGGIPSKLLPDKIFELHFSTKEQGMGLGLYISKMIIEENMQGSLSVSNEDKGALFTIEIPIG